MTKRLGSYWMSAKPDDVEKFVLFFPMTDSTRFEETLTLLLSSPQMEDGVLLYEFMNVRIYGKHVGKYFFLANSAASLNDTLDPTKFVQAKDDLSLDINLSRLLQDQQEDLQQLLAEAEASAKEAQHDPKLPESKKFVETGSLAFTKEYFRILQEDVERAVVSVNVDAADKNISFRLSIPAKTGSKFATMLRQWSQIENPLDVVYVALSIGARTYWSIPIGQSLQDSMLASMKELEQDANRELSFRSDLSEQQKTEMRRLHQRFRDVFRKTLQRGRIEFAAILHSLGREGSRLIVAFKVADGKELSKILEERAKTDRAWSANQTMRVASINDAPVHRINDFPLVETLGGPAHWAIINDTFYLAVGTGSLSAIEAMADAKPNSIGRHQWMNSPFGLRMDLLEVLRIFKNHLGSQAAKLLKAANGDGRIVFMQIVATPDELRAELKVGDAVAKVVSLTVRHLFDGVAPMP